MALRTGVLPPRYQDARLIAIGGMGEVYRATDTVLGRTVAVKLLSERYASDETVRERFAQLAVESMPMTVAEFAKFFREDVAAAVALVEAAKIPKQ